MAVHTDWRRSLPVVDAHAHFSPETVGDCVRFMDHNGIETMVELTPNVGEDLSEKLEAIQAYPGRFGVFAGVDFEGFGTDGWIDRECERIETAIEAGAIGIKFWKDLGLNHTDETGSVIPVDDERLTPIIDLLGDLDAVAAFHTADPKPFFEPLTPENPRYESLQEKPEWHFGDRDRYPYDWWDLLHQLETVIGRHPETTIVGVHFGCAAEELEYVTGLMCEHDHYCIDPSARIAHLGQHDRTDLRECVLEFSDRILFGTDPILREVDDGTLDSVTDRYERYWRFLETDQRDIFEHDLGEWTVDGLDLPRPVLESLYVDNARRVYGL